MLLYSLYANGPIKIYKKETQSEVQTRKSGDSL